MKRLIFATLLLLALVAAPVASARTLVLSVGISDYEGDQYDLERSGADAIKFADLMKQQNCNVTTITSKNATHDNVIAAIGKVCDAAKTGDRIMFFYSGHGAEGCIVSTELQPVTYNEMMKLFLGSKAKDIVLFFDACFSGSIARDVKRTDKNIVFFLSSRPNEMSQEDRSWVKSGFLTQALLKGLRGMADTDKDKNVTVIELFKYVYNDVVARIQKLNEVNGISVSQHPQLVSTKSNYNMVLTSW